VGLIDIHIFVQDQSREELKSNYLLSIFWLFFCLLL